MSRFKHVKPSGLRNGSSFQKQSPSPFFRDRQISGLYPSVISRPEYGSDKLRNLRAN
ncbi:hypothetical protein PISMIDRAFT_683768 [Pisolithus microcarpus 441]|uniref:Uncharacterized protein n=1 Tax=Pisolithus microcarpus 441 TaxID=765257 RepID=A0A0C9YYD7_9AGAM|nr:hypothetical protein PISMIDRAFT_683768 [Pisolithus microcarpus 441]